MEHYIYSADVYCARCAKHIQWELGQSGRAPANPADETSFDSDDYPKGPFDSEESDTPQHCAKCGEFLEQPLTSAGYAYVKESLDAAGETLTPTLRQWADFYGFERWTPPASAHEWLESKPICNYLIALLGQIDGDTIQDAFQSEMDSDGYFRPAGWYSGEAY